MSQFQKSLILFLSLSMSGVAISQDKLNIDLGKISDSVYSNEFFNLTFDVPSGWHVKSEQEILEMVGLAQDEGILQMEVDFKKSIILFMGKEREGKKYGDINSTFLVSACSKHLDYAYIPNETAYIDYVNKANKTVLPETAKALDSYMQRIGGMIFIVGETQIPLDYKSTLIQKHYVKFFDDVLLDITILYSDAENNENLMNTLKSVSFKGK